tara:strand:- start:800 stop:1354 length:555 start_codon:yes stop_codon:yes gene_type:complete
MYKILLLLVSLSFVGCAKAKLEPEDLIDPKYTVAQVEHDLKLPPKPSKIHPDYNTYNSVDSNNNKVRDSVERYIGFKYYPDKQAIAILNGLAKASFERQEAYEAGDMVKYKAGMQSVYKAMLCYKNFYKDRGVKDVLSQIKDTEDRKINFRKNSNKALSGTGLISFTSPLNNRDEYCKEGFPVK